MLYRGEASKRKAKEREERKRRAEAKVIEYIHNSGPGESGLKIASSNRKARMEKAEQMD